MSLSDVIEESSQQQNLIDKGVSMKTDGIRVVLIVGPIVAWLEYNYDKIPHMATKIFSSR